MKFEEMLGDFTQIDWKKQGKYILNDGIIHLDAMAGPSVAVCNAQKGVNCEVDSSVFKIMSAYCDRLDKANERLDRIATKFQNEVEFQNGQTS